MATSRARSSRLSFICAAAALPIGVALVGADALAVPPDPPPRPSSSVRPAVRPAPRASAAANPNDWQSSLPVKPNGAPPTAAGGQKRFGITGGKSLESQRFGVIGPPVDDPRAPPRPRIVEPPIPHDARPSVDEPDRFLDVVAVGGSRGFGCTGVLVAPRWILTARHCLPATRVIFGGSIAAAELTRPVLETRTPPDAALDLALLRIDATTAIPLRARRSEGEPGQPIGRARIVGFGANDVRGTTGAGTKRVADVAVFGWGCDDARSASTGCRPATEMLVGKHGTADTCNGDSGGPLFERANGGYRLVAITSRPAGGAAARCGDGGIYTRVDRAASWIEGVLASLEK